jgi:TP901 family phage tail tape measure protein
MSGMATWKAKIELDIKDLQKQLIDADEKIDKFSNEDRKVKLDIDTKTLESAIQKLNKMLDSLSKGTGDFKQFENLSKELSSIVSEVQSLSKAFGKVDDSGAKTLLSSIQNIDKSLAELSQNILNVNKNMNNMGGNTSGAVKQVENISNAYQNAAKEAEKLADAQSKIGQKTNISSGMKDTFPKTSENLEQVAQSEQKIQQEARAIQSKWEQAEKAIQNYMNAVTKLNNLKASDKSTGKKSYEIAGQIEEIEKLKKEAYDARQVLSSMINPQNVDTDTWKRYVDVINRLDQASNGSAESVNRLKDSLKNTLNSELNSLQNSIDKYQNIITQAQTYPSDFHPSTEYNTKLANLESANNVLKNYKSSLQGVNELTKEQQAEINKLTQNCEKAATEFKKLSAAEKGTVEVGIEKAIQRINKDLAENTKYSAEAKAGFNVLLEQLKSGDPSINLRKITEEIIKIENAEIAAGRAGKSLWDIFKTKSTYGFIGQMQSYLSMYVGFYGMVNGVKKAVSTITELDTALVDLKKTTAMNENQLENFYYDSNNVAKQMGVTTKEIIDQASAWSRLGYNTAEASTEMAKLSSQFASISPGMSVDESQSGLVSIMKAWSIDPDQVKSEIMDPINKLGNTMALSNQDIVEGMERSAAALAAVGTSVQDGLAMFSGIQEVLQNAEKSGTALRSVALRIRSFDESTEEYSKDLANITGELIDLTKTAEHAQGISIFKEGSTTEFKDLTDYFGEIADIWDEMSQKQQNDFLLKAFGRTQAQAGAALIQNYKGVTKALDEMEQSAGSSDKEMETIEQSLEYRINALKETWVGTIQQMVDRGDLGTIVDGLTKLSEGIGFVTGNLGLLKTAALGITGVLAFKNIGKCYVSA